MRLPSDFMPEFGSLTSLLLDMAQERSLLSSLDILVNRFSQRPAIAMTQIWLKRRSDKCSNCQYGGQCLHTHTCLHLVASASRYHKPIKTDEFTAKNFSTRIPLGFGIIGQLVATGKQAVINDIAENLQLLELPHWAPEAGVVSFLCQPLLKNNEVLGALAIFLRMEPVPEGIVWSRVIADHAAASIANAMAFEEIQSLKAQLELENQYLREEVIEARALGDIIGQSGEILHVIRQIDLVAPTDTTVLILGESGTGKELVAREIYKRSLRKEKALIKINCASIPKELYESEFFGHAKGAFTGALKDRAGRFQAADNGTLFFDEVGEIPLELQSKLLRTLQDGSFEKVGEEITRFVNVRIIAATNKNLEDELSKNRFRKDLYYRLNVFPIEIAPLRKRKEDIPLLANDFLNKACAKLDRPQTQLTGKNIKELQGYDWPGNIRELQNVIERAVITMQFGQLFFNLPTKGTTRIQMPNASDLSTAEERSPILTEAEMKLRERENIIVALIKSKGKIYGTDGAAHSLKIKPTTLSARIKKLGL